MNGVKTIGAAAAAIILIGLAIAAWVGNPTPGPATAAATTGRGDVRQLDPMLEARTKGAAEAPIMIYEMSDFQCPFCRDFFVETMPALFEEYVETGKVRFTFLNLPIIQIHPNAAEAHEFAMCAAAQDQFWPIHDALFGTQQEWERQRDPTPHFMSLVAEAGLDGEAFNQCMQSGMARRVVAQDVQSAMRNRLDKTPTFIIEGQAFMGGAPMETWRPMLDSLYALKTGGTGG